MIDDEVPGCWRGLGLPGLADVHTHFLPERMLRRVWAHFDEAGPLIGRHWPITYRDTEADRVATLGRLGVRMFTALAYAHRPGMAADLNGWTLDFAARTPGCLPSATFYPEPARHPRLAVLFAHAGAPEYREFLELAERHERAGLDTTMAFTDFFEEMAPFPAGLRPRLRDLGLAGKVLLGSDFPNIPYAYAHQLDALARLDLGDPWLRAVCWENARSMFAPRG